MMYVKSFSIAISLFKVPVEMSGTHPFMQMSGSGGYLISALKIHASEEIMAAHTAKKIKRE